jgi:hypothetical protein
VAARGESAMYVRYLRLRPSGPGDEHDPGQTRRTIASESGVATHGDDDGNDSSEEKDEEEAVPRYCSNCNQLRARVLLGQFKTCEICRNKGKRSKARRGQIENHLKQWVAIAGEQEVHNQGRAGFPPLIQTRPLTIEDYISI